MICIFLALLLCGLKTLSPTTATASNVEIISDGFSLRPQTHGHSDLLISRLNHGESQRIRFSFLVQYWPPASDPCPLCACLRIEQCCRPSLSTCMLQGWCRLTETWRKRNFRKDLGPGPFSLGVRVQKLVQRSEKKPSHMFERSSRSSGLLMLTTCESGEPLRSSFGAPKLVRTVEQLDPDPGHDVATRSRSKTMALLLWRQSTTNASSPSRYDDPPASR